MDPGTVAHIHLLVNHVPTVGAVIGLSLFVLSVRLGQRRPDARRPRTVRLHGVDYPGDVRDGRGGAARARRAGPGVSAAAIVRHEDAALMAFVAVQLTGFFSWLALWQSRRLSRPTRATIAAVLLLSVATLLSMTRAAYLGGEIHHPEILSSEEPAGGGDAAAGDAWLTTDAVHRFVAENKWVWPACETLHFVGLSLMFGILALVNLRMLGVMKAVPFAAVHRLLPWAVLGFVVNTVTGMLFLIGSPQQYHRQHGVLLEARVHDGRGRESALHHGASPDLAAAAGRRAVRDGQSAGGLVHVSVGRRDVLGPHAGLPRQGVLSAGVSRAGRHRQPHRPGRVRDSRLGGLSDRLERGAAGRSPRITPDG